MQVEYINPFIKSLINTFATMLGCDAKRGQLSLEKTGGRHYPISGVIGLSGRAVGAVVINLSEELALKAASSLLMAECTTIDDDVVDAVGELANIVAGQAKAELEELDMSVSLPNVITGKDHEIRFPTRSDAISVPFETPFGPMRLEVALEVAAVAAGA